ncbi:TetR/AcrR family transcriptional regulator [Aliiglaciecola sp. 3_MG-2023]|uniref:TetR/AcrR family transcriptional regulator n=1 Tax=Aliiglaciecola sp. 3_MG-2023 TaxID=3062644 RepID=UPI0026E1CACA|nr:TetR/AcrR family transcriptional regulator [Aliiglaciecola sp. 3_MG-2023]MDO6694739.1 TetR/AcrR family transcriptional regulator [Aliiglaciecola sp. 3_MG-2023]
MASGRKREFDSEAALDAAMHVFWQKGYIGASLMDLTDSMNISKPSMYRAFGNKESLFVKTTQRYIDTKMKAHLRLLFDEGVPLKQRLKNHMMSIVDMQCSSELSKGCYLVLCQSELVSGVIPKEAEQILLEAEAMPMQLYTDLFQRDPEAIELGLNQHAHANSLSLYTMLKGTASMARSGVTKSELEQSIDRIINGIGVH